MKDARLVIGAVIIKHKLCLSDVETVQQIQENPYMQYFVGLPGYQPTEPFAPSLFVEIRKRMGETVFEGFYRAIIDAHEGKKPVKPEPQTPAETADCPGSDVEQVEEKSMISSDETEDQAVPESTEAMHRGQLIIDATVVEQAIRFPTDLSLLNEAREFSEQIIDRLCANLKVEQNPNLSSESPLRVFGHCQTKASGGQNPAPRTQTAIAVSAP
ncbi:MAG: transposase [Sulfuricurvum sp.]